jgi:micrococcal nuclease
VNRRYPNRRHIDINVEPLERRRKNLNRVSISIAIIFIMIFVVTILIPDIRGRQADAPDGSDTATIPGAVTVQVVQIIDGDTLDVRAAATDLRVRLYGVDTPERGEACYQEATDRLQELAGSSVQLLPDARPQDPFGRELRYLYAMDGTFIDEALVAEGFGYAWTDDGSQRDQIVAAEQAAREAHRGCLWAN